MPHNSRKKYAILLDGGFLKRKLGSKNSPASAVDIANFTDKIQQDDRLKELELYRIYYYDAPPFSGKRSKPLRRQPENFALSPLFKNNQKMLEDLKQMPFFAVRLGELSFNGWSVDQKLFKNVDPKTQSLQLSHEHLKPIIAQKGVDMRIGLDIAALALKSHADMIVLVTGDSDFIPALKFARREGIQTFLFTLGHSVKEDVYAHVDLVCKTDHSKL